jgi:hypothetical protein
MRPPQEVPDCLIYQHRMGLHRAVAPILDPNHNCIRRIVEASPASYAAKRHFPKDRGGAVVTLTRCRGVGRRANARSESKVDIGAPSRKVRSYLNSGHRLERQAFLPAHQANPITPKV